MYTRKRKNRKKKGEEGRRRKQEDEERFRIQEVEDVDEDEGGVRSTESRKKATRVKRKTTRERTKSNEGQPDKKQFCGSSLSTCEQL